MNIGITQIKTFKIDDGAGGKKDKSYLEMSIRAPFMESATFTISKNEKKESESAPDFLINFSFNRKGENFPRSRAGALWNKVSENNLEYVGGHIESPLFPSGKIYISLFLAKQYENMPPLTHRHDVVWSPPRQASAAQDSNQEYSQTPQSYKPQDQTQSGEVPVIDIDEDDIPF